MTDQFAVIDTETSGLMDNKLPADHPTQPRLAHLAVICLDDELNETSSLDLYVKPEGWEMDEEDPRGAFAINGLSNAFLRENGQPICDVLERYSAILEQSYAICAYNAAFDLKVMRGELRRLGWPDHFETTRNICLMRAFKAYRNIVKGFRLVDACTYFGINLAKAHSATPDCRAAVEVLRHLVSLGALPEAQVHRSEHYEEIVARGRGVQQDRFEVECGPPQTQSRS